MSQDSKTYNPLDSLIMGDQAVSLQSSTLKTVEEKLLRHAKQRLFGNSNSSVYSKSQTRKKDRAESKQSKTNSQTNAKKSTSSEKSRYENKASNRNTVNNSPLDDLYNQSVASAADSASQSDKSQRKSIDPSLYDGNDPELDDKEIS